MDEPTAAPLRDWRFAGGLRTYQAEALEHLPTGGDDPLHVVAPPGSGKTLLGLLLAAREGDRALVLAPTLTIREQWVRTARTLAPDAATVSDDPARIGDLTVLTYQLLAVTGDGSPFEDLARTVWIEELVEAGRGDSDAETWLAELAVDNPASYRSGIRRRVRRLRTRFARRRPDELARVLHPNAVALIERIVAAGVRTVVLDECHHLLDHWALVAAYLAARIRENGSEPLLIGLTATLPSPDDETEYENYSQLLGPVDYEVPTPAVVKEGHLAPYRDHVLFVEPTPGEAAFIRRHEALLHDLLVQILSTDDGIRFLEDKLQHGEESADPLDRVDLAFSTDFALTRSCAVVLRELAPMHPLIAMIPAVLLDRCESADLLTTLTRFAQERLLSDPTAQHQWEHVRRALADFGLLLTDRGLRRGRDPLETTLAYSAGKDHAAVEILHRELASPDGERIRAVVVTDFVEHGNHRGGLGDAAAGARRAFELLAADPVTSGLRPVLLTAQQLRVRSADAAAIAASLEALIGSAVEIVAEPGATCGLRVAGGGRTVSAVSELISRGEVRLLVGTRGLLGEGWDCPAVNTLIDLTAVTTSSATQQLRGRTLRLDPAWPQKVAHNWSVACLIPSTVAIDDATEPNRLRRKHSHLWGLSAAGDGRIVAGFEHLLTAEAAEELTRILDKEPGSSVSALDGILAAQWPSRASTRAQWRIGETYSEQERDVVAVRRNRRDPLLRAAPAAGSGALASFFAGGVGTALVLLVLTWQGLPLPPVAGVALTASIGGIAAAASALPVLGRALHDRTHPADLYLRATIVVARTLREAGRIGAADEESIRARVEGDRVRIELGGTAHDRRIIADAVEELFGPVRTPRFLLRVDRAGAPRTRLLERLADRLSPGRTLLPVPRQIARRRADAERFGALWQKMVGTCTLVELQGTRGLALLRVARSSAPRLDPLEPRGRIWS